MRDIRIDRSRGVGFRRGVAGATVVAVCGVLALAGSALAAPDSYSWKYYTTGNTGVQGDYSDGLWIDPSGMLYLGGYVPSFEEGGFANFIEAENRWVNVSNVDYPVIGDPALTGSARISDFVPDGNGGLWMGTWRGALHYEPDVGPESIVRYDAGNSPLPGGRTYDVGVAPDGSVWFACRSVSWGGGGLVRYRPGTNEWKAWSYDVEADGWPGWVLCETVAIQPKPGGGYEIWIDDTFGIVSYDSDTETFTEHPRTSSAGTIMEIQGENAVDDAGNMWVTRYTTPGQPYALDYLRPDGTFGNPATPPWGGGNDYLAFRAMGNGACLLIGPNNDAFHYDGTTWSNLGRWRDGAFTYGIDMDESGNVWVSGNGGAARRDAETGQWQRYRVSNTSQMDYWVEDLTIAPNGDVWMANNGAPGIGGIVQFDGERWHGHNVETYGLGEDWPFPCDNAAAIAWNDAVGRVSFNPTNNGIREWDGSSYITYETGSSSEGIALGSDGKLWTVGTYFSLRYHDETGFHSVPIAGWGANIKPDPSRAGTVWACANLEVVRTDGDYRYSMENADFPELNPQHDVLTEVAVGPDGVAWVGSTEGLFRVDAESGTHQWWHSSNSDMPADQVTPLAVAPDGTVWFTNFNSQGFERALVWFDGTEFGTITRAEGLPHEQIWDAEVREVPGGYELWLACASRGIAVLTVPLNDPAGIADQDGPAPIRLEQNWPNPFTNQTDISYSLEGADQVRIDVFDVSGRLVRELWNGSSTPGSHSVAWDGRDRDLRPMPAGVYYYRLETSRGAVRRSMTLIR
ncbi:MAG: T9SS type A sorting domain-containing protein [Candidatus Eisenbacteria bacterium]|nr:T9SS type A sorting domain-containing protein [Candidatus Eisenbacteria bacterium]